MTTNVSHDGYCIECGAPIPSEVAIADSAGRRYAWRHPVRNALLGVVGIYQKYLSPLKMGPTCRFEPTCSAYAREAITARGALMGTTLALVRLIKCGPWHPGGYDPAPIRRSERRHRCGECSPTIT